MLGIATSNCPLNENSDADEGGDKLSMMITIIP